MVFPIKVKGEVLLRYLVKC